MIDLHCHVLPGIDDGPDTIDASIALVRAAIAAGARTIVATPHVSQRYPNDATTIAAAVHELNERLDAEGIDLDVRAGAEVALTSALEMSDESLARLTLGGGSWLLVEPPYAPGATGVDALLLEIARRGYGVLVAHPERCPAFRADRAALESIVRAGALTSVSAGSLVGRFGGEARRFARTLIRDGLVHNVASDAHDCTRRPPGVAAELRRARLQPLASWLTCEVPAAILSDREVPAVPVAVVEELRSRRKWARRPE